MDMSVTIGDLYSVLGGRLGVDAGEMVHNALTGLGTGVQSLESGIRDSEDCALVSKMAHYIVERIHRGYIGYDDNKIEVNALGLTAASDIDIATVIARTCLKAAARELGYFTATVADSVADSFAPSALEFAEEIGLVVPSTQQ